MNARAFLMIIVLFCLLISNIMSFASDCTRIRFQINGAVLEDHLGYAIAGVGDVNGDDTLDFIVGAPGADPNGIDQTGSAYLYSGADASLLDEFHGTDGRDSDEIFGDILGSSLTGVGDINSDQVPDFIVAAPLANPEGRIDAGSVFVYSGFDDSLLYRIDGVAGRRPGEFFGDVFGFSVAGLEDLDGDSISDFIIGAPYANPDSVSDAGSIYIYSGTNGLLLSQINGLSAGDYFGYSVSSAGDVDEDGKADFIVGAPHADPNGVFQAGSAYVFSGANDSILFQFNGTDSVDELGTSVAGIGDADKNGKPDFICGAPAGSPQGPGRPGKAIVYSGLNGFPLYLIAGLTPNDATGRSVAGAGDINGDGRKDFMVGARYADAGQIPDAGSVKVYSGVDGKLLYQLNGSSVNEFFGWAVAGIGDVDKNGRDDFMIGVRNYDPPIDLSDAGTAYLIFSGTVVKGDLNLDAELSPADVVSQLNAIFLGSSFPAPFCAADANCDAQLTPSDVVILLNAVFSGSPIPCVS